MMMYRCLHLLISIMGVVQADRLAVRRLHGVRETGTINPRASIPTWGTFTQKLDHFNPLDNRTWSMRYIYNEQFFQDGGPIFIYLGGEWTISESSLMRGQIFDMASDHNGYMFYTEHRFYGESYPTDDYSVENLTYHTADQALEDIATFITYQKSLDQFSDSKVVVIGGSYSAMLATWMRVKYPHLVHIAYSSSAPVEAIVDYYEYLEVVNDAIQEQDPDCLQSITEGFEEISEFLLDPNGTTYISELFRICDPTIDISSEPERAYFFSIIVYAWAGIIQYATVGSIERYCNVIEETEGSYTQKLLAFLESYYGDYDCIEGYQDYIEQYQNTQLTTNIIRQWEYQTCTQFGFYQTTSSDGQPFGNVIPIEYFFRSCQDIFNLDSRVLSDGVDRTNIVYGGKNVFATNVVNVHGANDPWHRAGIVSGDIHDLSPTIVIEGASHCQDLSSADIDSDTQQLYQAKIRIKQIIAEWLNDGTTTTTSTTPSDEDEQDNGGGTVQCSLIILVIATLLLLFR